MSRDYYEVLELQRSATESEIKKAYKRMALRWHPDKNQANKEEADRRFKEISEAYEVLSDQHKREIYDKYGKEGLDGYPASGRRGNATSPGGFGGFEHFVFRDPQEVFREFFGGRDPFAEFFNNDHFGQGRHANTMFQSNVSGFPGFGGFGGFGGLSGFGGGQDPFMAFQSMSSGGGGGGGGGQFVSFQSSNYGPSTHFKSSSTSTRMVNGRTVTTKKVVENGVETVTVIEDGVVTKRTVNGQAQHLEGQSQPRLSLSGSGQRNNGQLRRSGAHGGSSKTVGQVGKRPRNTRG